MIWEVGVGKTYTDIQSAFDALFALVGITPFTETQTIRVFDGTYTGTFTTNATMQPTATYRLIIEVAAGNTAILNGNGWFINYGLIIGNNYTTVDGFKVQGYYYFGIGYSFLNYGEVKNCEFTNNAVFPQMAYFNQYYKLHHNICHDNGSHGLSVEGGGNNQIYNNLIYNENGYGAISGGANYGDLIVNNLILNSNIGIAMYGRGWQEMHNNTIYDCNIGIHTESGNNAVYIKNNIIYALKGQYCITYTATTAWGTLDRNIYFTDTDAIVGKYAGVDAITIADWRLATGQDTNSLDEDPKLKNRFGTTISDFRIYYNSPGIGIGEDLSALFNYDINDNIRTIPFNLGANDDIYRLIKNQMLSNYNPTQDQIITAECDIVESVLNQVVKMNNKSFALTLVSGVHYRAIIPAYQIGLCTNKPVAFMVTRYSGGEEQYASSNISVTLNGNYDIAVIESAIINLITTQVPTLATVLNYEPKQMPALPAVTLWYDGFDQTQTEAVSYTINHKWIMKLYVRLHDAKIAQDDMKDFIKKILSAFKSDLSLTHTVLKEVVPSAVTGAVLDKNNPILMCNFNLTTMTEED
jgi:hypothetical protein